eukprot:12726556-Ditylum_brightwellii.AAC.1
MPFEEWILKLNTTVASNKECQQRHQDHDATMRVQSIFQGYSAQQQLHSQTYAAVHLQTFLQGYITPKHHQIPDVSSRTS